MSPEVWDFSPNKSLFLVHPKRGNNTGSYQVGRKPHKLCCPVIFTRPLTGVESTSHVISFGVELCVNLTFLLWVPAPLNWSNFVLALGSGNQAELENVADMADISV